ncbi:GNAT family N-acetyltransferase [Luteimonas saliphila]|uniref:GNAT family N-acetyltransferase n=1 Tax=Luteimonas saliphila TaxID=2804919 RepID=UPI00192D6D87|nr:GNAT family N-acetyltransferase [Luteimonas saliphila]
MHIRDYIPGEAAELRRVFASSVHTLARGVYTPEQLDAWAPAAYDQQAWADKLNAMRPFVALIEGRVVGYADLQATGHVGHFFVAGDASGRGVGGALMRHLHNVAAARGISRLSADVSLAAEGFFARHGFVVEQRRTVVARGVPMANARMVKAMDG